MTNQLQQLTPKQFFNAPKVQQQFDNVLKGSGKEFATSILTIIQTNNQLRQATNESILTSAMKAATLKLPIEPSLGYAYIVAYGRQAQFQLGYKGLIQLAQRSGKYKSINSGVVYKSQFISYNPLFEELEIDFTQPQDEVVGYFAAFKLLNGFEKVTYWTKEQAYAHGKRFSKTFNNGPWKSDFDAMAQKTVLKQIISKYGPLSVEMEKALIDDNKTENEKAAPIDVTPCENPENISDIMGPSEVLEAPVSDESEKMDNLPTDVEKSENEAPVKSEEGSGQPAVENPELAEEISLFEGHTTQVKEYD